MAEATAGVPHARVEATAGVPLAGVLRGGCREAPLVLASPLPASGAGPAGEIALMAAPGLPHRVACPLRLGCTWAHAYFGKP